MSGISRGLHPQGRDQSEEDHLMIVRNRITGKVTFISGDIETSEIDDLPPTLLADYHTTLQKLEVKAGAIGEHGPWREPNFEQEIENAEEALTEVKSVGSTVMGGIFRSSAIKAFESSKMRWGWAKETDTSKSRGRVLMLDRSADACKDFIEGCREAVKFLSSRLSSVPNYIGHEDIVYWKKLNEQFEGAETTYVEKKGRLEMYLSLEAQHAS